MAITTKICFPAELEELRADVDAKANARFAKIVESAHRRIGVRTSASGSVPTKLHVLSHVDWYRGIAKIAGHRELGVMSKNGPEKGKNRRYG
jgi:hypothetical protein